MPRSGGFTLIELVVAVALFAIAATLAYAGLDAVIRAQTGQQEAAADLAELQTVYRLLREDIEQIDDRPVRDQLGDTEAALSTGTGGLLLALTRAGRPNPAGLPRSDLQRVYYRLDEDGLLRGAMAHLDRTAGTPLRERLLSERVDTFELRFLDGNGQWLPTWPPLQVSAAEAGLPLVIEVTLTLDETPAVRWLFELPR